MSERIETSNIALKITIPAETQKATGEDGNEDDISPEVTVWPFPGDFYIEQVGPTVSGGSRLDMIRLKRSQAEQLCRELTKWLASAAENQMPKLQVTETHGRITSDSQRIVTRVRTYECDIP